VLASGTQFGRSFHKCLRGLDDLRKRIRLAVPVQISSPLSRPRLSGRLRKTSARWEYAFLTQRARDLNERLMICSLVGDLRTLARVVYCQRLPDGRFGVGLQFQGEVVNWSKGSMAGAPIERPAPGIFAPSIPYSIAARSGSTPRGNSTCKNARPSRSAAQALRRERVGVGEDYCSKIKTAGFGSLNETTTNFEVETTYTMPLPPMLPPVLPLPFVGSEGPPPSRTVFPR